MNIPTMRQIIAEAYPRRTWKTKVREMSDEQVIAVYKSMKAEGRLVQHPPRNDPDKELTFSRQIPPKVMEDEWNPFHRGYRLPDEYREDPRVESMILMEAFANPC